jgi:hypothetical protein
MFPVKEADLHATESYPGTQAVARAIALLKAFSDAQPEWTLNELAHATGLNKTTAFRLLSALEAEHLVMRNPLSGAYRLGMELIALGGVGDALESLAHRQQADAGSPWLSSPARQRRWRFCWKGVCLCSMRSPATTRWA